MEGIITFMVLLDVFQPVFTQPSFATFRLLMTGWILSHRHRYVTDLILSSDSVGNGHFSDYHRFFSHASWSIDQLWRLLAGLLIKVLIGSDAVILLSGDDTLCRKRGLGLFGVGMHHDPLISSRGQEAGELGPRLGHAVSGHCKPLVGPHQSVRVADLHAVVSQSARADEGEEEKAHEAQSERPEAPHATGTDARNAETCGGVVSRAAVLVRG